MTGTMIDNLRPDKMENILVVDDEADILKLISENLFIRGYQVSKAKNGSEALDQLRLSQTSLLVLDIKLPDFTGWELLKRIKSDPQISPEFPVLVMTASVTDAKIDRESYPNVVEILVKPFNIHRLVSTVKRILSNP